jgi:SAM-dependent methyltransferase
MSGSASAYGDDNAGIYDQIYPRIERQTLDRLQQFAAGRRVLELGVGTGRCARPLSARGMDVVGVDASAAMLALCRRRDVGQGLPLVRADLANLPFRSGFGLIYALVSTLTLLPDRTAQRNALMGVACALNPGGCFIDEGDAAAGAPGENLARTFEVPWPGAPAGVYRYRMLPLPPPVLDELAQQAGLLCLARWRNWNGDEWRATDSLAISVYQRAVS